MSPEYRIPVVSVVGKSDSGKTTVVEGLIRALTAHGWKVATVKHHIHEVEVDQPGKDSWRHAHAGSRVTMISSPTQFVVVRRVDEERSIEQLVEAAADCDILITEGFRRSGPVRVEVMRRARSDELITDAADLFALVTDMPELAPVGVPLFDLNDHAGVVALIERTYLTDRR
jgi:molybdopterin-guanine dinucleotide biosynthesis protein MobB